MRLPASRGIRAKRGIRPLRMVAFSALLEWYQRDWSGQCNCGHEHKETNPTGEAPPLKTIAASLAQRIRKSAAKAQKEVNAMTRRQVMELQREMAIAQKEIAAAIKEFDHNPLLTTEAKRKAALPGLQKKINKSLDDALARQSALLEAQTQEAIHNGLFWGVQDTVDQKAKGGWGKLTQSQVGEIATNAQGIISKEGIQFLTAYRLELAGNVAEGIKQKIKGVLQTSMLTGEPLYEIQRKLGHVPIDPEVFRHAGGKIFPSAANRMQLISATENNRVHNMGKIAFHEKIGVREVMWLTSQSDRVCEICAPLHGEVFSINDLPDLPAHPDCECTVVPEVDSIDMTPSEFLEAA